MMAHFREICIEHGNAVRQCRCPGGVETKVPCPGDKCRGRKKAENANSTEDIQIKWWSDTPTRRETGLIEHHCRHGVGHPNAGSIERMRDITGQESWGVHGCDGCCSRQDFPGSASNTLKFTFNMYSEKLPGYIKSVDPELNDIFKHLYIGVSDITDEDVAHYFFNLHPSYRAEIKEKAEFLYYALRAIESKFYADR